MSTPETDLGAALERFADAAAILCAFDFDGTLSEIVADADRAVAVPGAIEALMALADLPDTHVAILSGRRHIELAERFTDRRFHLVGEHGYDRGQTDERTPEQLDALIAALRALAQEAPGTRVETKRRSVVLHTRTTQGGLGPTIAQRARELIADDSDITVMAGKEVLEFSLTGTHKGQALHALRTALGVNRTLYVGDDVTDEYGFAALGAGDIAVKVGEGSTAARYRVDRPADVLTLIRTLLNARR